MEKKLDKKELDEWLDEFIKRDDPVPDLGAIIFAQRCRLVKLEGFLRQARALIPDEGIIAKAIDQELHDIREENGEGEHISE